MSVLTGKKIGFIGAGQMGEGIFGGILRAGLIAPQNMYVSDIMDDRLDQLREKYGLKTVNTSTNAGLKELVSSVDIIFLAILPQIAPQLLPYINECLDPERHLVFSIMGGVKLAGVEKFIDHTPVIRVMPNTPMCVNEGCAGISLGRNATRPEHKETALEIFNALGIGLLLPESSIDPLTGISGCGPAFCGIMVQALADGGVYLGLSRTNAIKIAAQTLIGTGKMILDTGIHPEVLKDNVCSPGGGTIGGAISLERNAFRSACIQAVLESVARMQEVVE